MRERTPVHEMTVRYVRWLTRTDPRYTVVGQVRARGRCIWEWYINGWEDYPGVERGIDI